jgi:5-methylcytosine-specific restriction endonuclease McrA
LEEGGGERQTGETKGQKPVRILSTTPHNICTRNWRLAHPALQKAAIKEWAEKHPERIKAALRKWRSTHREQIRTYQRSWYKTLSGRASCKESKHKRRNKEKGCPDARTAIHLILSKKLCRCFYCGKSMQPHRMDIDHIKPLSDGGAHAAFNLAPACPHCNRAKNNKRPNEFIRNGQLILVY